MAPGLAVVFRAQVVRRARVVSFQLSNPWHPERLPCVSKILLCPSGSKQGTRHGTRRGRCMSRTAPLRGEYGHPEWYWLWLVVEETPSVTALRRHLPRKPGGGEWAFFVR